MAILGRKKTSKNNQEKKNSEKQSQEKEVNKLRKSGVGIHDIIAPSGIERTAHDFIKLGPYYSKSLMVTGVPRQIEIGTILSPMLNHPGDVDIAIHIEPYDEREALDELVRTGARLKAEWIGAKKTGDESMEEELEIAIGDTRALRDVISTGTSRLFSVNIVANLFNKDREELEEETALLEGQLALRSVHSRTADGRTDEGFLTGTCLGVNFTQDTRKNFDSVAVSTLFPFLTSDLMHPGGFPFGINMFTAAPIFYDPYDLSLDNHNGFIISSSGKGKSTLAKTFLNRSLFIGEKSVVIDLMGEYVKLALARGGVAVKIGGGEHFVNPCDITPGYNKELGTYMVNLDEKISDMTSLVAVMCGTLDAEEETLVETLWVKIYREIFGFTEEPESLYEEKHDMDDKGVFRSGKFLKKMPRLSDFYKEGEKLLGNTPKLQRVMTIMKRFLAGNPLGFLDCYTNVELPDKPIVVFDLSAITNEAAITIAWQSTLTWVEQHFIKRDKDEKGRVWMDEGWRTMRGKVKDVAISFVEDLYRRARHHKKGITLISQDFGPFAENEQAKAIFQNSDTKIFLNSEKAELDAMKDYFGLSEGEVEFLASCGLGEGILKVKSRSVAFKIVNTPSEQKVVYSTKRKRNTTDVLGV